MRLALLALLTILGSQSAFSQCGALALNPITGQFDCRGPATTTTTPVVQDGSLLYCADAGASDTYTCSLNPDLTVYTTGQVITFKPNTTNTGAATLNIDSLGAKAIVTSANSALSDSMLVAGSIYQIYYDGTSFRMGQDAASTNTVINDVRCNKCTLDNTAITNPYTNDTVTGTTNNKLAKLTGAPSKAIISGATDIGGAIGVVQSGGGTSGESLITMQGKVDCVFGGATTAGNYVIHDTTAGNCKDGGSTYPVNRQVIGRVLTTNGGAGTYQVALFGAEFIQSRAPLPTTFTPPPLCASLTWDNQDGSTCTDGNGYLTLYKAGDAVGEIRGLYEAMGANTKCTAVFYPMIEQRDVNEVGIFLREAATGKITAISITHNGTFEFQVNKWTNSTTFSASIALTGHLASPFSFGPGVILQVENDGTNVNYKWSGDGGINFNTWFTEAKAVFFTTAPDQCGIFVNPQNANNPVSMSLISWLKN